MQLVSCDGGSYDEEHPPKNILRNDETVYCSRKRNCVNIQLKHNDLNNQPFELSSIQIKAPKLGYSSPVTCGMVFVSMHEIKMHRNDNIDSSEQEQGLSEAEYLAQSLWDEQPSLALSATGEEEHENDDVSERSEDFDVMFGGIEYPPFSHKTCIPDSEIHASSGGRCGQIADTDISHSSVFNINPLTHSATIDFYPHLSGRYILFKLFSGPPNLAPSDSTSRNGSNSFVGLRRRRTVDIQCIRCSGYTGRRVFPSVKAI